MPLRHEVLEQVAVVAGELDDEARAPSPRRRDRHADVVLGVLQPGVGVGGEIGVLGEDLLRADVLLELDEEALPQTQTWSG